MKGKKVEIQATKDNEVIKVVIDSVEEEDTRNFDAIQMDLYNSGFIPDGLPELVGDRKDRVYIHTYVRS